MTNYHHKYIKYKTKYLKLSRSLQKGKEYVISVREPWFSLIKQKIKKVEGRLNRGLFSKIKIGDIIVFQNKDKFGNLNSVKTKIIDKKIYKTFEELIENEKIENILPNQGFNSISQAVAVYRQWYSKEDEKDSVVGIHLKVI